MKKPNILLVTADDMNWDAELVPTVAWSKAPHRTLTA